VDEWSHVAWADRVQRFAGAIPDDHGLLVSETREKMPAVLRRLVSAEHNTWLAFCDAVRKISLVALREAMEFENGLVTKGDLEHAQLNTPSKGLARTLQYMTLGPRIPQPNFQSRPRPALVSLQNTQNRRPDIDRLPDLTHLALPIHPDTPAGRALYIIQLATWDAASNGRPPNELRPYPLTPGSSPVASGECWTCGHTGHMRSACPGTPIPPAEKKWRSIAASIKSQVASGGAAVNFVNIDMPDEGAFVSGADLEEFLAWKGSTVNQGKAEGSSM